MYDSGIGSEFLCCAVRAWACESLTSVAGSMGVNRKPKLCVEEYPIGYWFLVGNKGI